MNTTTVELVSPGWHTVLGRYRKFLPQVALALLYGWTVITDRLTSGDTLDGVTIVAAVLAVGQAVGVVWPGNPIAKAVWSLAAVVGQAVTAGVSDGHVSTAEAALIISAFIAWATGAATTNTPAPLPAVPVDPHLVARPPADHGSATIAHVARAGVLLILALLLAALVGVAGAGRSHAATWQDHCPSLLTAHPWSRASYASCRREQWRGPLVVRVRNWR